MKGCSSKKTDKNLCLQGADILVEKTDTKQEITQNNVKIAILCIKEINQDNTLERQGGEVARLDREVEEGHSK